MDLVVADEADLNALRTRERLAVRRIRLAGPLADERLERDLNRAYFACGCAAGSIAVSLTLYACLLLGLLRGFEAELAWWRILLYLLAASIGGKLAGLLLARIRLHRLLCRLSADARDKLPTKPDPRDLIGEAGLLARGDAARMRRCDAAIRSTNVALAAGAKELGE